MNMKIISAIFWGMAWQNFCYWLLYKVGDMPTIIPTIIFGTASVLCHILGLFNKPKPPKSN